MFSGRHDLETMQCKDGSFLGLTLDTFSNYLCDGEEVIESFPKSTDVIAIELIRNTKFYQLDSLTALL